MKKALSQERQNPNGPGGEAEGGSISWTNRRTLLVASGQAPEVLQDRSRKLGAKKTRKVDVRYSRH